MSSVFVVAAIALGIVATAGHLATTWLRVAAMKRGRAAAARLALPASLLLAATPHVLVVLLDPRLVPLSLASAVVTRNAALLRFRVARGETAGSP